ncbi:DUF3850 domain-containing protein [Caulobacter rhizosphaerae]|uniref:DUF3850 domain-containing protein n=1 Tax=Caulobacter rhizosphaerae TaxID=2010972 RepID=UPI0013D805B0|nr:DUF3850 domain-containing protein [Caulobacter rhizosphaerae]GGL48132.1 hypothetical protein GCM10010983_51870 [Caulobacter rhizosphaerae]
MQTRNVHELKCWPAHFAAIRRGDKRFELRKNDREFAIGDLVVLREFSPADTTYTGQTEERMITFLLSEEEFGVVHGFVAIGFGPLPGLETPPGPEDASTEDLVAWHTRQADSAALRAQNARTMAEAYRHPASGRQAMPVAADRHAAVADAAAAEARFHARAAAIFERCV